MESFGNKPWVVIPRCFCVLRQNLGNTGSSDRVPISVFEQGLGYLFGECIHVICHGTRYPVTEWHHAYLIAFSQKA